MTIPIGSVVNYSLPAAPQSLTETWLLCDGSLVLRSMYPSLFGVIGEMYGAGDGLSNFALPDLIGRFVRSPNTTAAGATGADPDAATRAPMNTGGNGGDAVGSIQDQALTSHFHGLENTWGSDNAGGTTCKLNSTGDGSSVGVTQATGGSDCRPINAALSFLILAEQPTQRFPVGAMMPYGGETDPAASSDGDLWMICDGRPGQGEFTGPIPDCRGRFLRGVDNGSGRDPDAGSRQPGFPGGPSGDVAGSLQDDMFANHAHGLAGSEDISHIGGADTQVMGAPGDGDSAGYTDSAMVGTGAETRPINAYLNMIIRVA